MLPRRYLPVVSALMLGAMSVSAHAATIQITMENLVISPAEASAKVGDTIEWGSDWDVTMPPKKTVTLVLKKAGTVEYYCRFHPNMKATLVVAP